MLERPPVFTNDLLDLHYLIDRFGFIFITEGYYHPPKIVRSRLTYFPDPFGKIYIQGKSYSKFYGSNRNLKKIVPVEYVNNSSPDGSGCFVPIKNIYQILDPRLGLKENPHLETIITSLTDIGINCQGNIGVIGSYLLRANNDDSDIDIVIYGKENAKILLSNYKNLKLKHSWTCPTNDDIQRRAIKYKKNYNLTIKENLLLNSIRKRSRLDFRLPNGKIIGFHCVYLPEEIPPNPIKSNQHKDDEIEFTGKILSDIESCFMPRVYLVHHNQNNKKYSVITYMWRFWVAADQGDNVLVRGKLIDDYTILLSDHIHGV